MGNRIKQEQDGVLIRYDYDPANQLVNERSAAGRTTYTFDAAGNQHVVLAPDGGRTTYTWDYENRNTAVEQPDGEIVTFQYSAEGQRVSKETTSIETKFVWDGERYLLETDDFGGTVAVYTNEPHMYGNLISQRQAGATSYYHFDALGSTSQLTDQGGVITDGLLYRAFGEILSHTGTTPTPFRFVGAPGYHWDAETGQVYVRRRYYAAAIARWKSRDPLGFIDGPNLYAYVHNNPAHLLDPMGGVTCNHAYWCCVYRTLKVEAFFAACAGALLGAGIAVPAACVTAGTVTLGTACWAAILAAGGGCFLVCSAGAEYAADWWDDCM